MNANISLRKDKRGKPRRSMPLRRGKAVKLLQSCVLKGRLGGRVGGTFSNTSQEKGKTRAQFSQNIYIEGKAEMEKIFHKYILREGRKGLRIHL